MRTDDSDVLDTADTKVRTTAVMLTVSWNCRNRLTASLTARPHLSALTIDVEVVVHEDDGRSLLGDLGTGDAHGKAYIGRLQSLGVIGAVTGNSDNLVLLLQALDQNPFVVRAGARQDVQSRDDLVLLGLAKVAELGPFHDDAVVLEDTTVFGDRLSRELVVAGDHANNNTSALAIPNGFDDTGSQGVLDTDHADESHVPADIFKHDLVSRPVSTAHGLREAIVRSPDR